MKLKILSVMVIFSVSFVHGSAEKRNIVVFVNDFRLADSKMKKDIGAALAGTAAGTMSSSAAVDVITPETRRKAMQELAFSQISGGELAVPRVLSADYVINGTYTVAGDAITISAEIVNTEDQSVVDSFKMDGRTVKAPEIAGRVGFNLLVLMKKHGLINHEVIDNPAKKIEPSIRAYTYYSLGLKAYYSSPATAYEYFRKAAASDPEYADAIIESASAALDMSKYDTAMDLAVNGEKILNRYNLKYTLQFSRMMLVKGMIYLKLGNYTAALESCIASLNHLKGIKMSGTSYEAESLNGIALVLRKTGRYREAAAKYAEALRILEIRGMKESVQYAELINNMAALEIVAGNITKALEYNSASMEIKEKKGMGKSRSYAVSLSNRGVMMAALKKNKEAIEFFSSAGRMLEQLDLEDTDEYALTESNAGFSLWEINKNSEAVKKFENAQRIRRKTGSRGTEDYYKTAIKLAKCYYTAGDSCKALKTVRDVKSGSKLKNPDENDELVFINELEKKCK